MISISNIAWDTSIDDEVAKILSKNEVNNIDIAHPKYFQSPNKTKKSEIEQVKNYWQGKGIAPIGMQSLLFGTQGLNVFGSIEVQNKLLTHLADICHIGDILGARKLVFGSPKNRDRSHLNDQQTMTTAVNFFYQLGDIAKKNNVVICLEPNPTCYNANFMTNSLETANVVAKINHPNIRMQLDIGAMNINHENALSTIENVSPWIHHIHISEPQLAPLNINNPYHKEVATAIRSIFPTMPMTIEMLTTNKEMALIEIEQSIRVINKIYRRD